MADIKRRIEGRLVVASGTLVLDATDKNFTITIDGFNFNFSFLDGPGGPKVQTPKSGTNEVRVEFVGFNNVLPIMWNSKAIARMNSKEMHASMSIVTVEGKTGPLREVGYTFTVEP